MMFTTMNRLVFTIILIFVLACMSGSALAMTPVTNPSELQAMQDNLAEDYVLMNDIDMTGYDFSPIGNDSAPFTGTFNGDGYAVSNLNVNRPDDLYVGLFGYTSPGAQISDFSLVNLTVVGLAYAGGIVAYNSGSISDVSVSGDISARSRLGGAAGWNLGSIENVHISGTVLVSNTSGLSTGGLAGRNQGGYIADSSFDGDVRGGRAAGGFVGSNHDGGLIERSRSTGNVDNNHLPIQGGLGRMGGFAGQNIYGSTIRDCYSNTNVSNKRDTTGGFAGLNYDQSTITNSYSTGDVWGQNGYGIGGFVGESYYGSSSIACFWDVDTQTHGVTTSAGGTGLSTAAMQTEATFLSAGWDFTNIWAMVDYPRFQSEVPAQTILEFFDDAVEAGTLVGQGSGKSAENRLNALRNMILEAGALEDAGDICGARGQLQAAYEKVDGQSPPPDFAAGPAAPTLADMILDKIADLGC